LTTDHVLRGMLTAEVFVAVLLFGPFLGLLWHDRGWPIRVVLIGLEGMLLYVLAGQVKAFNLSIPFDGFSVVGAVASAVLDVGLVWSVHRERRRYGRE
jgi:hypothetical protein